MDEMRRDEALTILRKLLPDLKTGFGVEALYLFGSTARDEATPQSDVDVLIAFEPEAHPTLFDLARIRHLLATALEAETDLVMQDAISPQLKEQILREAIHAA
ncbi:MAG: nucleotidyltransferase family protein [Truepera sp.]|nr:nucleotidyltransferase family protein [Truepera sp.]